MSIEKSVQAAIRHLQEKDFLSALTFACIALDATGKAEFHTSSEKRCRQLVKANLDIVTCVTFSNAIYAAPTASLWLSKPEDPKTPSPLEDIIYKSIRCNLLHEATLPPGVEFTEMARYGGGNGVFFLPVMIIPALILIVVCSPTNRDCELKLSPTMRINNVDVQLNMYWGRGADLRKLLNIGPA